MLDDCLSLFYLLFRTSAVFLRPQQFSDQIISNTETDPLSDRLVSPTASRLYHPQQPTPAPARRDGTGQLGSALGGSRKAPGVSGWRYATPPHTTSRARDRTSPGPTGVRGWRDTIPPHHQSNQGQGQPRTDRDQRVAVRDPSTHHQSGEGQGQSRTDYECMPGCYRPHPVRTPPSSLPSTLPSPWQHTDASARHGPGPGRDPMTPRLGCPAGHSPGVPLIAR